MRRKKMNIKKRIGLVILILILLLILCVVLLKILEMPEEKVYIPSSPVNTDGWMGYKNTLSDVYEGVKDTYQINTIIKQVFEVYIPVIKDEIFNLDNADKILEYYELNTEYINNRLCIKDKNEFEKIINKLLELNCDLAVLNYCIYLEGSYEKINDYELITFSMHYTEDKKITLDALISGEYNNMNIELKMH